MAINIAFYRVVLVKEKGARYDIERYINSPRASYETIKAIYDVGMYTQEIFLVLFLNTKNYILGVHEIGRGTINFCPIDIKLLFQAGLLHNAAKMILIHNHPSGDASPSFEDIDLTKKIVECGKIMDMDVIDHIVVGGNNYTSFKEKGII